MAFPINPSDGQIITENGQNYKYNSSSNSWLKTNIILDNTIISNATDTTKKATLDLSSNTTETTRNYKFPDASGTLSLDLMGSKVILPDQTTNVILDATKTVDVCEYLICNQTTSGISIILPNPTNTTNIRRLIFVNTGSVSVIVNNATIGVGSYQTFVWNGSTWSSKESLVKDNLTATTDPTPQSDSSIGYSVGSTWINTSTSITWTCIDAIKGGAKWISSANTIYFDNWDILVADLTNPTISHVGKYIVLNNANGGNVSGTTYKSTDTLTTTITDSGSATYYVSADYYSTSSAYYTVVCQNRTTPSNQLAISGVYTSTTTASSLVSSFGSTSTFYAIWTSVASADSSIITPNAIMKYSNNTWSVYQSFNNAPEVVMVGSNANWNPYCKVGATWINFGINTTALSVCNAYNNTIQTISGIKKILLTNAGYTQGTGVTFDSTNGIFKINTTGNYKLSGFIAQGNSSATSSYYTYQFYTCSSTGVLGSAINNEIGVTSDSNVLGDKGLVTYASLTAGTYICLAQPTSGSSGYAYSVSASIEQLPSATYVPANASIPTPLAYGYYGMSDYGTTLALTGGIWTRVSGTAINVVSNNITNTNGYFRFTITQAGTYEISSSSSLSSPSGGTWAMSSIYKNGSSIIMGTRSYIVTSGTSVTSDACYTGTFDVGDYIDLYVYTGNGGYFAGGYLSVKQLPSSTYVPANALTSTALNWLKLGGTGNFTTTSGGYLKLPLTAQQGNNISYNVSTGITTISKASNYKITFKPGSAAYTSFGLIQLQYSTDGTTWSWLASCLPEAPSATQTAISPQDIHWEGSLVANSYIRISTAGAGVLGSTGDITSYPMIYIEEIPSATVIQPNTTPVQEWVNYTPIITATTTNPSYASTYVMKAMYKVVGKSLHLSFMYYGGANAGGGGTGSYLFSLPSGYAINTSVTGTTSTGADGLPVGNGFAFQNNANTGILSAIVYDSTHLALLDHSVNMMVGSSRYSLGVASERIAFTAEIPII